MKKALKYTMFLLASAALFSACGEKDNDPSDAPSGGGSSSAPSKKIKQIELDYYGDIWINRYTWDGDNIVELATVRDGRVEQKSRYEYEGNRISRETETRYYDGEGGYRETVGKYIYAGSHIERVELTEYMYLEGESQPYEQEYDGTRRYTWGDGKPVRIIDEGRHESITHTYQFEGDNLVKMDVDHGYSTTISYDNGKNPFPLMYQFHWSGVQFDGWSVNNITKMEDSRGTITYDYTYDADGYPVSAKQTEVDEEGREWEVTITYTYYE